MNQADAGFPGRLGMVGSCAPASPNALMASMGRLEPEACAICLPSGDRRACFHRRGRGKFTEGLLLSDSSSTISPERVVSKTNLLPSGDQSG